MPKADEALDALLGPAKAGATDEWLASQAGVSVRQVQLWKRKRGLTSDKGPIQEAVVALQGLAQNYDPVAHRTAGDLDWAPPEFLLRRPLDYTQYARACFTLQAVASFTTKQISKATGTRPEDVELALATWKRHLTAHGKPCLGCRALLDHRFAEFCCTSCHDRHTR